MQKSNSKLIFSLLLFLFSCSNENPNNDSILGEKNDSLKTEISITDSSMTIKKIDKKSSKEVSNITITDSSLTIK